MEENEELLKLQKKATGRQPFCKDGFVLFEWDQSLEEVHFYIKIENLKKHFSSIKNCLNSSSSSSSSFSSSSQPSTAQEEEKTKEKKEEKKKEKELNAEAEDIKINRNNLQISISPNSVKVAFTKYPDSPYLHETTFSTVDSAESFWTIEDDECDILLSKMRVGEVWVAATKTQQTFDEIQKQFVNKQLLLQRFQKENPSFDFSDATFSGSAPDPRTFMGGMSYNRN